MSYGIFIDKNYIPDPDSIEFALSKKYKIWKSLETFIDTNYKSKNELKYYGKNYSWAKRYKKSGKSLISIFPNNKFFTALIVLNENQAKEAIAANIKEETRSYIESANPYFDGRWIFLKIKTIKDYNDLIKLIRIKYPLKKLERG